MKHETKKVPAYVNAVISKRISMWNELFPDALKWVTSCNAYSDGKSYIPYQALEKADGRPIKEIIMDALVKTHKHELTNDPCESLVVVCESDRRKKEYISDIRTQIDRLLHLGYGAFFDANVGSDVLRKFYKRGDTWFDESMARALKFATAKKQ